MICRQCHNTVHSHSTAFGDPNVQCSPVESSWHVDAQSPGALALSLGQASTLALWYIRKKDAHSPKPQAQPDGFLTPECLLSFPLLLQRPESLSVTAL